jgi:hypothetical protein
VVARIPTGLESYEVAVSPDRKLAVITNTGPYSDPGHTLSGIAAAAWFAERAFRWINPIGPARHRAPR